MEKPALRGQTAGLGMSFVPMVFATVAWGSAPTAVAASEAADEVIQLLLGRVGAIVVDCPNPSDTDGGQPLCAEYYAPFRQFMSEWDKHSGSAMQGHEMALMVAWRRDGDTYSRFYRLDDSEEILVEFHAGLIRIQARTVPRSARSASS